MTPSSRESLPALTGARFFAAFAVVVCHYGMESVRAIHPALVAPVASGPAAVSMFYVLSGAVLTWGCTRTDGAPARPQRTFWAQRAARIAPAYFLALFLSLLPFVFSVLKLHPGSGGVLRCLVSFVAALFVVQAFVPPITAGLNTPGWSISCEAFFYALWPRLVVTLKSDAQGFPWKRVLVLWLLALVPPLSGITGLWLRWIPEGPFPTILEDVSGGELLQRALTYFPPLRLAEFALGVVLGHAMKTTPPVTRSVAVDTARELLLLAAILGFGAALGAGVLASVSGVPLATRISIESGMMAPLFALLVWQLARGRGLVHRFLSRPTLLLLGEASYALYVLQEPVLVWYSGTLKRVAPSLAARWDIGFGVYAVLLIALSILAFRFIETPLRARLTSRWIPRRAPAPVTTG